MEDKRTSGVWVAVIALALLLPALYVGSYFALVERIDVGGSALPPTYLMRYRGGGAWASRFFRPAHTLDQKLRPEYWGRTVELFGE